MPPEQRQHLIGEYLQRVEFAALEEIASQVDASISTVRRDLSILEAGGTVQRTHGGARIVTPRLCASTRVLAMGAEVKA